MDKKIFSLIISNLLIISTGASQNHLIANAQTNQDPLSAAQGPKQSSDLPSLGSIMSKVMLAYGGKDALLKQLSFCTIEGKLFNPDSNDLQNLSSSFKEQRLSFKTRIEVNNEGNITVRTCDGLRSWQTINGALTNLDLADTNRIKAQRERKPAALAHYLDAGYSFYLLGRKQGKNGSEYLIEVKDQDGTATIFHVDDKNYLVQEIEYDDTIGNSTQKVNTVYSQYRPIGGTMFAFQQETSIAGHPTSVLQVESIDFERPIDSKLFEHPDTRQRFKLTSNVNIPFEYFQNEIIVHAKINDSEPLDFIVDTGATDTIIDRKVAADCFLTKDSELAIKSAQGNVKSNVSNISKFELSGVTFNDLSCLITDMTNQSRILDRKIAGIIGTNLLNQFTFTINYGATRLTLQDMATFRPPAGSTVINFQNKQGPIIECLINGKEKLDFLIDTGAAGNFLPTDIAKRHLGSSKVQISNGIGLDSKITKLGTVTLDSILLGNQSVTKPEFQYLQEDANTQGKEGFFWNSRVGIIGNALLECFIVSIDYKNKRIVIHPDMAGRNDHSLDEIIKEADQKLVVMRDFRGAAEGYRKALSMAESINNQKKVAVTLGRLGNLYRIMSKDLGRPEQAKEAWAYYTKAQEKSRAINDKKIEARILADWSLLYSDNKQYGEASETINAALLLNPNDANILVDYAVQLWRTGQHLEMQRYIEKALSLEPSNWQALWYQVKLAEVFRDNAKLKNTLKEILKYYPWSKTAAQRLNSLQNSAGPAY